ncbi:prohibitin family protein [Pseudoalteromonas sp. Of7M-16]|uniref:prohibitin family protein n=1 Tax=Pseudoalteromonas sp. Of7M-16 TaxID=2917756 RepID=UPI001EF3F88E|nr:prohibitin family protein [Pseudoalteromonas sp. Of7M-16]MCG7549012.1 prohibitin family protein [Pseudoalteromonas sp. Of7M-16]
MNIILPSDITLTIIISAIVAIILSNILMRILKRYQPKLRRRILSWRFRAGLTLLVTIFIVIALIPVIFIKVDSGEVGVLWKRFAGGTYLDAPLHEGTVLVFPWDTLTIYSSRYQTAHTNVYAITNEGLRITLDITVRYRPEVDFIPYLHKLVGPDYVDEIILPEVSSGVRMIVSQYNAEQVYGNQRKEVQEELLGQVLNELELKEKSMLRQEAQMMAGHHLVNLDDVLIKRVDLPDKVHGAIISKVNQNYILEEYKMRVEVAKKEALRKEEEAKGIALFQEMVSDGISEAYLKWRGIEATIELAKSNNAKVVVIGSGKDGLPLILNTESSLTPQNSSFKETHKPGELEAKLQEQSDIGKKGDYLNSVDKFGHKLKPDLRQPDKTLSDRSLQTGEPMEYLK